MSSARYAEVANRYARQVVEGEVLACRWAKAAAQRHLSQAQASGILGIPQPKLSDMLRGQFRGISEAKMLECMNRLRRDVEIVVRKPSRLRATGQTRVVFA